MNGKELVNNINQINFGIQGFTFLSIIIYVNRQYIGSGSGVDWAVFALGFSIAGGALIWGLMQFRVSEVHFKNDKKTVRITGLQISLNALGFVLIAMGEFMVYYTEKQNFTTPEGLHVTATKPYLFQGIPIFIAGTIILLSTLYLYKRFIPQQIITEPEVVNTQTVSLH